MASPQLENGHVKIANDLWDALARIRISGDEWRVLNVIIRKTYGWNKKEDQISLSQFVLATGLKKPHIIRARQKLLSKKITITKKDNGGNIIYRINKDFEMWEPLPKKITVTNNGNKSLPKKVPTKDTTKDNNIICPYQSILKLWKKILPEAIQPQKWDEEDKSLMRARWVTSEKTQNIEWWEKFFIFIKASPFLMGQIDPREGHQRFKLRLQWLLTKKNFKKVIERYYHKD